MKLGTFVYAVSSIYGYLCVPHPNKTRRVHSVHHGKPWLWERKKQANDRAFYRPPTKLGEGNVFSRVCHSLHRMVPCDHYQWCIGTIQESPCTWTPSPTRDPCPLPWAFLYLFNLDLTGQGLHPLGIFKLKHLRFASGRLVSYWNAFLPSLFF